MIRRNNRLVIGLLLSGAVVGLAVLAVGYLRHSPPDLQLSDVTAVTGITFRHTDGSCGQHYVIETVSAGLALFDYDGDGDIDIYFLNGSPLKDCPGKPAGNALYRNEGNWVFTEVTAESGLFQGGYGLGVAVGDYDADGDADVYCNDAGPNQLYRNNGDGTFSPAAVEAGVGNGDRIGAGVNFLDMDADGDLDLFVANYLDFRYDRHEVVTIDGVPAYVSPDHYDPVPNTLYRNEGDGTFRDVTQESGIAQHASWGMGTVCADYDIDGDTDVFVANDVSANFLFENDGRGNFSEVGAVAGVAYDGFGSPQGSMGVDCGDYNRDGLLDFYQTSYQMQHAVLYKNFGGGLFQDVTAATGAGEGTFPHVTWGTGFADFDNDGDRDLFVACGHLQDNIEHYDKSTAYEAPNLLLLNSGDGHFTNVSDRAGDGLLVRRSSRGAALDDLDQDGDTDIVVLNSRTSSTVLRNDSAAGNHWLQLRLVGTRANRDGVGARVQVLAGDLVQVDEVHSGRGYQSHFGSRLHFGLGPRRRVDRVEVHWIGGGIDVRENVDADQVLMIIERP